MLPHYNSSIFVFCQISFESRISKLFIIEYTKQNELYIQLGAILYV